VVAFMSDHGMSFPYAKTTIYKCGTWTPMIIRPPGLASPGVDEQHMVSNTDVMPTLLEYLNIKPPDGMDGRSLVSLIGGENDAKRQHVFTHMNTQVQHKAYPSRCVRTAKSAYIFNTWADGKTEFKNESQAGLTFTAMRAAAKDDPKIATRVEMFLHRRPQEFYDLSTDPHERDNKIAAAEHKEEIERLKQLMEEQMKATGDPLLKDFEKIRKG